MRPSCTQLASRGFWGRTLDELKRVSLSAMRQEGVTVPWRPYMLMDFTRPEQIEDVKKMSDKDIGGFSTVNFDHVPATEKEPAHARWHGNISIELPKDRPEVHRTGYAAWRNKDLGYTLLGRQIWNIDAYTYLAMRIKSDGRRYFVNIQTESIIPTDIHQHRLYAKTPGQWETFVVPWHEFVRTNHGAVVEPQTEMLRERVKSIGVGSTDRQIGPYELSIEKVWATNDPEGKLEAEEKAHSKQLKSGEQQE